MEPDTETETDGNYKESLENLKRNTEDLYSSTKQAYKAFQRVLEQYKEASGPFHETPQRVHGSFKLWCMDHGFENRISLQEFLAYVFEQYGKQQRLNVSDRTLTIDKSLASAMGFNAEETLHLHTFLCRAHALIENKS